MLTIRNDLRSVQRELRADVERLESRLQFLNIGFIPLLIAMIAGSLGVIRLLRRRRIWRRENWRASVSHA